jgi:hypothetical protein
MLRLRGQLDPDAGAIVLAALDALTPAPTSADTRTPAQRRADALTDLARLPLQADLLPTTGGLRPHIGIIVTPDTLTTPDVEPGPKAVLSRRLTLAEHQRARRTDPAYSARSTDPGYPAGADRSPSESDRRRADADPLAAAGIPPQPQPPWLNWVGPVPVETAQRLACDSVLYRILYDPATGQPLDVGRAHRTAPPWIRRALHARDRGCRWPGCDAAIPWTDAHHVTPWSEGGSTSVDAMLLLCRWHHTKVHEGHWHLEFDPATAQVSITRPDGRPYEFGPSTPWLTTHARAA